MVEWEAICRMAEAGVPSGYALRQGKQLRAANRRKNKTKKKRIETMSDEWYGKRHISHAALRGAVYRGNIERRGGWCRLVRDPVMTQRMWMMVVYQVLGKAHPTLSGEFIAKPPKTLASVTQKHLGRQLLPEEFVRRRPGRAGSWEPADMELFSRSLMSHSVEQRARWVVDYQARVEDAPIIWERPRFEANLPKAKARR